MVGLQKSGRTQAPLIARFKPWEVIFGARGAKVVAEIFRVGQKFIGHNRAHRMAAVILRAGVTVPIPEKTSNGGYRTGLKGLVINV